ncbi:hypothetical protein M2152_001551 [Microbacteriaceae bacterium SG_E_30_P1]|uniref:HNH nuclease domain-containing protein n=1 Tax=Antiquaquibacter oligotrophicus TaxID=2880260 RepID=A0ABT6KNC5_9MICO|nr:HNH endonuclease signature motif containing protein [Antiquaquibacter oligotrophicus]MDH6181369.1 hypothetical protein [Antiquaquibacter oligotrophicus]UDF12938.1 HNH endonuclease [Antiquaquibacter oligotrophicus]
MTSTTASYAELADLSVAFTPPSPAGLNDAGLLSAKRELAEIRRRLDAADSLVSAEIANRSRPDLGYDGLAQRLGARTPEHLIQRVAGVSKKDARTQIRVGTLVTGLTDAAAPVDPWLRGVASAVAAGSLSLDAADAIRTGLGSAGSGVTVVALTAAADQLLREARELTVERLGARARELRASLDLEHVAEREELLRSKRYLHLIPRADGMTRLDGLLDPESTARLKAVYDAATSPRRGGPRFVDPTSIAQADALIDDTRTTEQIALDTFLVLLELGTQADVSTFIGARKPAVQVLVTKADLDQHTGMAFIEGESEALSVATAERHVCESGAVPILMDDGQVINLGRELRLFNRRQRIALAARDGGCIWPGCDRPPSWCEAHHIVEWSRDGRTDIADGVLLCRHHHMLVHNNHWTVVRYGNRYAIVPPASIDPTRTPRAAQTKSPAARRLMSQAGR